MDGREVRAVEFGSTGSLVERRVVGVVGSADRVGNVAESSGGLRLNEDFKGTTGSYDVDVSMLLGVVERRARKGRRKVGGIRHGESMIALVVVRQIILRIFSKSFVGRVEWSSKPEAWRH